MSAYADTAWSRELVRTSRSHLALWTSAAVLALAAHATAAWVITRQPPEPLIQEAGSAAIEVDLAALGFAEADQVSAGDEGEAVEPVTEAEPVQPVTEAATPVEPVQAQPVQPVEQAPEVVQAEQIEPSPPSEVSIASAAPIERPEIVEPVTPTAQIPVEELEPVDPVEQEVAAIVNVPLPAPRPDYTPTVTPRPERPRVERERERRPERQQTQRRAGSQGENQADTRRGREDGSRNARAAQQGEGTRRAAAGNAAVSNYPGQVAAKLRRSVRSVRTRDRGEVVVSFTVSRNGSVSSVSIARGSGSSTLDQAALDTVRRAAPFPPIPEAAGRSSWQFSLPVGFTR